MQKVQQRVGSFTGSSLNANFAVDRQYGERLSQPVSFGLMQYG